MIFLISPAQDFVSILSSICLICRASFPNSSSKIICPLYLKFSLPSWAFLLCLGLITQVGGYFSINYALGYIDSSSVSILTLHQPILTAVFPVIVLNKAFTVYHIIGGVLVLVGLVITLLLIDNGHHIKSISKTDNIR